MKDIAEAGRVAAGAAVGPALRHVWRVFRERQTALGKRPPRTSFLKRNLEETLGRLTTGSVDAEWWRVLLNKVEQPLVSPKWLEDPHVQSWLQLAQVRRDLRNEAQARLLGVRKFDPKRKARLQTAYADLSGERRELANGPIDAVLAVLVAGYVASISIELQPIAGLVQASAEVIGSELAQIGEKVSGLGRKLDAAAENKNGNPLTVRVHSERASERLLTLLRCRGFDADGVRKGLRTLLEDTAEGELRFATWETREQILYWVLRLNSGETSTLAEAQRALGELESMGSHLDLGIPRAFILATQGKVDEALRQLSDIDTADGRSTFFGYMKRTRGLEAALNAVEPKASDTNFFSPIGWFNYCAALWEGKRYEEAFELICNVQSLAVEWPDLAFLEGVLSTGMLLPTGLRDRAMRLDISDRKVRPVDGPGSVAYRERADSAFQRAQNLFDALGDLGKARGGAARDFRMWLSLTDPDETARKVAQEAVREAMKNGRTAVDTLPFAIGFDIEFDSAPLRRYLEMRGLVGAVEPKELAAELLLAELQMSDAELAKFLEREGGRFEGRISREAIVGKRIEALAGAGEIEEARIVLEANRSIFEGNKDFERLAILIGIQAGDDGRTQLEALYKETSQPIDLQNLVRLLEKAKDWEALDRYARKLFEVERNPSNASRVLRCIRHKRKDKAKRTIEFFEGAQEVLDWSPEFRADKAWALFGLGRHQEATVLLERLLAERKDDSDTQLEINLAIQTGNWERFSSIVDREWARKDSLSSELLLRLAFIAAEADSSPERALKLAALAAEKSPTDPNVLIKAYSLAVQTGQENQANPAWLPEAARLSGDAGPLKRVDMRTVVEEMIPTGRKRGEDLNAKIIGGEVPISFATKVLGLPLARLLLEQPNSNEAERDGRRRVVIPTISGSRVVRPVAKGSKIALDNTSLFVLSWLGVLGEVLGGEDHFYIASSALVMLLDERRRVRFHQPSRVVKAEHILRLLDRRKVNIAESARPSPEWLKKEVGIELAELLVEANAQSGVVVHAGPVYKVGAYMEQEADLREFSHLVVSLETLISRFYHAGRLTENDYRRGLAALKATEGSQDGASEEPITPGVKIYVDNLALTYLNDAELLETFVHGGAEILVHSSTKEDLDALVAASEEGKLLIERLNQIRLLLRDHLKIGKVGILPAFESEAGETTDASTEIVGVAAECDALCIDDRFINRFNAFNESGGKSRPIVCALDIIRRLYEHGVVQEARFRALLHRMRAGGIALCSIEAVELRQLMASARFDKNGLLVESIEMTVLRQYLARIRTIELVQPGEMQFLEKLQRNSAATIRGTWEAEKLPEERASAIADWLWVNVFPHPVDWLPHLREVGRSSEVSWALAVSAGLLTMPLVNVSPKRAAAYAKWVDQNVVGPLRASSKRAADLLVSTVSSQLSQLARTIPR